MRPSNLFCAATLLLLPAVASAAQTIGWRHDADPRLTVNPISATEFEVIEARGAGAQDIWCAAAYYAEYTLGRDRGRLYVSVPRGPAQTAPGRTGVTFTLREIAEPRTGVSVTVRREGENLPIFHALQFCRNYTIELDD
jgi:hypothetical protein